MGEPQAGVARNGAAQSAIGVAVLRSGGRWWFGPLLAVVSGLLLYASHPPMDLGPLGFVAVAPLFVTLLGCRRPLRGAALGLLCGVCFFGPLLSYIAMFGLLPWVALVIFQALFIAGVGFLVSYIRACESAPTQVLGLAAAWCLMEILRARVGALSFTFGQLCYTQHDLPPMLQAASFLGPTAVSTLVALPSAGLAVAITCWADQRLRSQLIVGAYGVVLLAYLGGGLSMRFGQAAISPPDPTRASTVAVVQANIPLHTPVNADDVEACRREYPRMTEAMPSGADLIVWPETALPLTLNRDTEMLGKVKRIARERDSHMLVGAIETDDAGLIYNSAYLISPAGEWVDTYRKVSLVIFGEYVPGRERFRFLQRYPIRSFDFTPGGSRNLLEVNARPYGTLICFEGIFPQPTREVCLEGAQALVVITSDSWAIDPSKQTRSAEVLQHSATATMRAVEARRYLVRAATTGRSAVISPWGETLAEVPAFTAGTIEESIQCLDTLSLYHRWGDLPLVIILVGLWAAAFADSRRPSWSLSEQPEAK